MHFKNSRGNYIVDHGKYKIMEKSWNCVFKFQAVYGKYSKISNTSCLLKRPRQTAQIQIRLLLKSSLIRVFHVCYSDKYFVNSRPENQKNF